MMTRVRQVDRVIFLLVRWSGGRGEQLGEQTGALGGGAYLQVEDRTIQVETEVEEGAALLFRCGEGRDGLDVLNRESQPAAVRDLLVFGAAHQPLPLLGAPADGGGGQRAGHRFGPPPLSFIAIIAWGQLNRDRAPAGGVQKTALGIAAACTIRERVQAVQRAPQRSGELLQFGGTAFSVGDPGGEARPKVGADV
jgi:hypothetical protein